MALKRWMSKPIRVTALMAAAFALLTILFFWRLTLLGEVLYWGTPLLQFFPWRSFAVQEYLAGRTPLWNPYVGFGAPLAANFQSGVFYPLNLFYLFLPTERAMTLTLLLHVFIAGVLSYGYGRTLALSRPAAFVLALGFMFGGYLIARGGFLSVTSTIVWLPGHLLCIEKLHRTYQDADRSKTLIWCAALALVLGLTLTAGHIQLAYYSMLASGLYLLFRALVKDNPSSGELRAASGIPAKTGVALLMAGGTAYALGIALAAVQLLPGWELAVNSVRRAGAEYDFATGYSLFPGQLLGSVAPTFFGSQAEGDWWGPGAPWEGVIYLGVLPLLLAVIGIRYHPSRVKWFFVALAAAAIFLATGRYNPFFPFLFQNLPGLALFQAPARFMVWYAFSVAVLSGLGWHALFAEDVVTRGARIGRISVALGTGMLVTASGLMLSGLTGPLSRASVEAVQSGGGWMTAAGLLLALRPYTSGIDWRTAAAAGLVFLDLFSFGWQLNPTTDARLYTMSPTSQLETLRQKAGLGRTYVTEATYRAMQERYFSFQRFDPTEWEEIQEAKDALMPNLAMNLGVYEAHNYDPVRLARPHQLQQAAESHGLPGPVLDAMGVKYVVAFDGHGNVQERQREPPRAYVAPKAVIVQNDADALAALMQASFDPEREVVLEAPGDLAIPSGTGGGTAKFASYASQRVTLDVTSGGGVLILSDAYYPGWRATVDGVNTTIWPANVAFRAVVMPPGEHTVVFWYDPDSFKVGTIMSSVALAVVAGIAGYGVRGLRRGAKRGT